MRVKNNKRKKCRKSRAMTTTPKVYATILLAGSYDSCFMWLLERHKYNSALSHSLIPLLFCWSSIFISFTPPPELWTVCVLLRMLNVVSRRFFQQKSKWKRIVSEIEHNQPAHSTHNNLLWNEDNQTSKNSNAKKKENNDNGFARTVRINRIKKV